jgi:hypothetical protein
MELFHRKLPGESNLVQKLLLQNPVRAIPQMEPASPFSVDKTSSKPEM